DAAEVLVRKRKQAARHVDRLAVEEGRELADQGADDVDGLDLELARHRVDELAQLGADDREDDEGLFTRGALEDGEHDLLRPHPGVQTNDRARLGELQQGGANDLFRCLARGIADDVDEASHRRRILPERAGCASGLENALVRPFRARQKMLTDLRTVTGAPVNGLTRASRKARAMQLPTGVPAKGGPSTTAVVARPFGAKVT